MANVIKIKKGLDINLKGKASDVLLNGGKSDSYAIVPDYYNGIVPKVVAKVGEKVKAGSVLMIDKNRPEIIGGSAGRQPTDWSSWNPGLSSVFHIGRGRSYNSVKNNEAHVYG